MTGSDVDERALQAAMDAFEPLSSVLRYRGRNANGESNWHTCDRLAMRHALAAYEAAKPVAPMGASGEPVAWIWVHEDGDLSFTANTDTKRVWEGTMKRVLEPVYTRPTPAAPAGMVEAMREIYEWYDRDGSVGGANVVFEKHRALFSATDAKDGAEVTGNG